MSICNDHSMTNHHDIGFFALLGEKLRQWRRRRQQRQELSRLSERDLHDLGISWSEMIYEAEKPFWRA